MRYYIKNYMSTTTTVGVRYIVQNTAPVVLRLLR